MHVAALPVFRQIDVTSSSARVGLLSDTHIPEARPTLWPQVFDAFAGVDLILHAGDVHDVDLIEQLATVAPTFAARGNGEDGSGGRPVQPDHPDWQFAWLFDVAGVRIGMSHDLPVPEHPPGYVLAEARQQLFGDQRVDVLVSGHSHVELIETIDGILCVNPGSPTYPHNLQVQLGTVGFLDIADGVAEASIWQLCDGGIEPFDWARWRR